jgi:hypothetical protein
MTSEKYRDNAAQCLSLAQHVINPDHKKMLLQMAQAWNDLADRADRKGARDDSESKNR